MSKYYIRKDSDGDYSVIDEEEKEKNENENFKICCIGCIGLFLLGVIAYVIILICGSDPTGNVLSWLAVPFVLVLEFVQIDVPFINWIPVDWIPIANISPLF